MVGLSQNVVMDLNGSSIHNQNMVTTFGMTVVQVQDSEHEKKNDLKMF
jgi:hypothetical protein